MTPLWLAAWVAVTFAAIAYCALWAAGSFTP